jgi:hypothetical protein
MNEYRISYLSVGRDILRSQVRVKRPASQSLVIADPDFNLEDLTPQPPLPYEGMGGGKLLSSYGCIVTSLFPNTKKFIYDLWGDAANTASRMEFHVCQVVFKFRVLLTSN